MSKRLKIEGVCDKRIEDCNDCPLLHQGYDFDDIGYSPRHCNLEENEEIETLSLHYLIPHNCPLDDW